MARRHGTKGARGVLQSVCRRARAERQHPHAQKAAGHVAPGSASPPDDLLQDLCSRFILNCPAEELQSFERILFLVEQARWRASARF